MSHHRSPSRLASLAILALACAGAGSSSVALAQPDSNHRRLHKNDFRREVEEMEQQWRSATLNDDVGAMDKLLSDDYIGISMSGQINTKAQQLDRLRNRTMVLSQVDLSDVRVKVVGSVAIVTGYAQITGTNDGAPVSGEYRYTRVYKRLLTGFWKITNFEVTRVPQRLAVAPPAPGR